MRSVFKLTAKIICALLGVVVLALAAAACWRIHNQHVAASTLTIRTPNGIEEAGYQSIGGIEHTSVPDRS